jgi:hypothetical protein
MVDKTKSRNLLLRATILIRKFCQKFNADLLCLIFPTYLCRLGAMDSLQNDGALRRLEMFFTTGPITKPSAEGVTPAVQRKIPYRSNATVLAGKLHIGRVYHQ